MEKFELEYPIELCGGSVVRALVVRAPSVEAIEAAAPGYIASGRREVDIPQELWAALLASATDLPVELVGELDCQDFDAVSQLVGELMSRVIDEERVRVGISL